LRSTLPLASSYSSSSTTAGPLLAKRVCRTVNSFRKQASKRFTSSDCDSQFQTCIQIENCIEREPAIRFLYRHAWPRINAVFLLLHGTFNALGTLFAHECSLSHSQPASRSGKWCFSTCGARARHFKSFKSFKHFKHFKR